MIIAIDADNNNNNNSSDLSSPKTSNSNTNANVINEQHRLLASTCSLNRQHSSPSVLDSSPKWITTNSVRASSPPITEANNLMPMIRNTNNIQRNDSTSALTASLISPEAEADLKATSWRSFPSNFLCKFNNCKHACNAFSKCFLDMHVVANCLHAPDMFIFTVLALRE